MTRRKKILIIAGLVLLVILLLLLLMWRATPPSVPAQPVVVPSNNDGVISTPEETERVEVRVQNSLPETTARIFIERYGSYSTESDFGNLRDVIALATPAFAAQLQATIDAGQKGGEYYGVTTRVIATTSFDMDAAAGRASYAATTQRQEAVGSAQDVSVKYQDITVTLEKVGGEWKVSGATWL